eukprot:CAMPEP_0180342752 /NCGR_PEP_ID=MMETSP0989-20121125/1913_1 /TAXON_ID=697907 /ORGANISM="non described non described, Strain CCMP2293" /LENGTH=595 /DNA_ID=CAMNT_0022331649 /DNA_START=100 /DNA_END=1884 /DNA_ORIENTATION=-
MLQVALTEEVINPRTSGLTAAAVSLVLLTTLGGNILQRLNNSYWFSSESILAIFVGFIASVPLCSPAVSHLRPDKSFDTIFFLYLVPSILFESGFSLNHKDFFRNFSAIVLLAVVGTVVAALITGMSLFGLASNGHITGIDSASPKEALLFGALLSATDPVATLAVLGSLNVDAQLYALVFGESVLNDAVAIVLFQTFDALPSEATHFHVSSAQVFSALSSFVAIGLGSVFFGVVFGLASAVLTKRLILKAAAPSEVTIMLAMAYLSFIAADAARLSGLMAVFFCGITMSHYAQYNLSPEGQKTTHNVARTLAHLSEQLTFLYFGFTILPMIVRSCDIAEDVDPYRLDLGFVAWTLLLCFLSRAAHVVPLVLFLNFVVKRSPRQRISRINLRSGFMLWFSGLRGAIAFALSLTISSPNRKYIIPCVAAVVLFTNIFLGQLTAPLLKLLKIPTGIVQTSQEEDEAGSAAPGSSHEMEPVGSHGTAAESAHVQVSTSDSSISLRNFEVPESLRIGPWHAWWRRFDEERLKPLFGGRFRRDAASQQHHQHFSTDVPLLSRDGLGHIDLGSPDDSIEEEAKRHDPGEIEMGHVGVGLIG